MTSPTRTRQLPILHATPAPNLTRTVELTVGTDGTIAGLFLPTDLATALGGFEAVGEAAGFWTGWTRARALDADIPGIRAQVLARMRACDLCEYRCGTDRTAPLDRRTVCGVGTTSVVHQVTTLAHEEAVISPAATVFLSGCALRCTHCHSAEFSWREQGTRLSASAAVDALLVDGLPRTVQFVGGNPDHHLLFALDVLAALRERVGDAMPPVVWNSVLYVPEDVVALLAQVVDVFVPDFKWWDDACARRVGQVPSVVHRDETDRRYTTVLARNLAALPDDVRVIVRHVPVPGHAACCTTPIRRWAASEPRLQRDGNFYHEPPYLAIETPTLPRRGAPADVRE